MGLFPLLPLYATEFGATPATVGYYFALMYVANTAGSLLTGRLAQWLGRRGAFVVVGVLGLPALFLMGRVTAFWQLVLLTAVAWFSGGMNIALANVLTGLHADNRRRGASFSLMFLTMPLGSLFGGAIVGHLVEWYGFTTMFNILTVVWLAVPLIGLLALEEPAVATAPRKVAKRSGGPQPSLGRRFALLMGITFFSSLAIQADRLGAPLSMQALNFSAAEISTATAVAGLATVPVALLLGTLSDRLGRERFLTLSYLLAAVAAATLAGATQLWQFWLAVTLMTVSLSTSGALASALATDALPASALTRGLPRIKAMNSIAGIVSFASAGLALQTLGPVSLFVVAALFAGIAALGVHPLHVACGEIVRLWRLPLFSLDCYGQAGSAQQVAST
jgi:MFS family permease